jgi:aldehyde dehydrogenase (NAD+)
VYRGPVTAGEWPREKTGWFPECAEAADLPPGVVNVISADRDEAVGLVASPQVDKIGFTGASRSAARSPRRPPPASRVTLELGGKSAAILLDDVALPQAMRALAPFKCRSPAKSASPRRGLSHPRSRMAEVVDTYAEIVKGLTMGDPWDPATQVGPVLNGCQLDTVLGYIESGRRQGARVVTEALAARDSIAASSWNRRSLRTSHRT